jgi:uncharacterized integral membrane protein
MSKIKVVFLIILAVVLADFALENSQPSPMIHIFKLPLAELPTYLLVYVSLVLGLGIGWIAHGLRIRRKRREAQAAQAASAQQQQKPQESQESGQA